MVSKIDHIGIAVESIEESLKLYTDILGLTLEGTEVVEEQKVKTAFLPIGDTEIELLDQPIRMDLLQDSSKRGQGIQHIAFRVDDIEKALAEMKDKGVRLIDEKPRYGAGGAKIAFYILSQPMEHLSNSVKKRLV